MEHKWALYFHGGRVICVRSWQREVRLVAETRRVDDAIEVFRIHGSVLGDGEPAAFTIQALDFLLATHAMLLPWPAPLPPDGPAGDREAARSPCAAASSPSRRSVRCGPIRCCTLPPHMANRARSVD
jgi:hypothetical protein